MHDTPKKREASFAFHLLSHEGIALSVNLPRLMDCSRQLEKNIDFQRSDLAHGLCRLEKFVFGNGLRSISSRCVQIDPLDELHIV